MKLNQWQVAVGVLIGVVLLGAAQGARAQSDDYPPGFVPPDAATLKCESGVANNLSKLRACAEKCHIKAAAAGLVGKPFDEEACEKTDTVKSCKAHYDASTSNLAACPCVDPNLLAIGMEGQLDQRALFCAGVQPISPDETGAGFVPPDAATLKCESGVANSISKLEQCITKCHIKAAAAAVAGKPFDDEACEKTDPTKSCKAQYDASVAKLVAGCPVCLDASGLAVLAEYDLDSGRGAIYCAGTTPF